MTGSRPALAIHGAGRMGHLVWEAADDSGFDVVEVVSRERAAWSGDCWKPSIGASGRHIDLIIDFSLPDGAGAACEWAAEHQVPLVSGTTGLADEQRHMLAQAAKQTPVLWAANFSIGLNICLQLAQRLAGITPADSDITITDIHHVNKLDAPSGTALVLEEALAPLDAEIQSIREGDVVGTHEILLELDGESVSLQHTASERIIFARGALKAGAWLIGQAPGLYSMRDYLDGQK